jgi:hypothetical protein
MSQEPADGEGATDAELEVSAPPELGDGMGGAGVLLVEPATGVNETGLELSCDGEKIGVTFV